jgi:hypothetical protein
MRRLQRAERELRSFKGDLLAGHVPMPHEACALAHIRLALTHIAMADLCMGVVGKLPLPDMVFKKLAGLAKD